MKYARVANETTNDRALMDRLLKDALDLVKYSGCQLYCVKLEELHKKLSNVF